MAKVALLIGISEYKNPPLRPLPSVLKNLEVVQHALQSLGFDVCIHSNLDPLGMEKAVEALFENREREDFLLLYLSGHGAKDNNGKFYFATPGTEINRNNGQLYVATAIQANVIQNKMNKCISKDIVVILDCCFSGAFAEGMVVQAQGKRRAILTSSNSTEYSFVQQPSEPSTYTRYIVEGLRGAATQNRDEQISVNDLHEYVEKKVRIDSPDMQPKLYAAEDGFKIIIAKAPPPDDPKLKYRREVEEKAKAGHGVFTVPGRETLNQLQVRLDISLTEAGEIEATVLRPYQEYNEKLNKYEQAIVQTIEQNTYPLGDPIRRDLRHLRAVLGLEQDENAQKVEDELLKISTRGTVYVQLRNLLKTEQWKKADRLTEKIMMKIVNREKDLNEKSLEAFPTSDLVIIDQLWRVYSNQKFGFSVQKKIFLELAKDVKDFGERVSWIDKKFLGNQFSWKDFDELVFDLDNAPLGHLPWSWANLHNESVFATEGSKKRIKLLLSHSSL